MKEMRRVLALLLCFVMLVGYVPVGALAAEGETTAPVETQAVATEAAAAAAEDEPVPTTTGTIEEPKGTTAPVETTASVAASEPEEVTITGISVVELPEKTSYLIGEEPYFNGLCVDAEYSDGTVEDFYNYEVSQVSTSTAGTKTVEVTFGDLKDTFEIEVCAQAVTDLDDIITVLSEGLTGAIGWSFDSVEIGGELAEDAAVCYLVELAGYQGGDVRVDMNVAYVDGDEEVRAFLVGMDQNGYVLDRIEDVSVEGWEDEEDPTFYGVDAGFVVPESAIDEGKFIVALGNVAPDADIPEDAVLSHLKLDTADMKTNYFLTEDNYNGNVYLEIDGLKVYAVYTDAEGTEYDMKLDWDQFGDETGYGLSFDDLTTVGQKTVKVTYGTLEPVTFKVNVCEETISLDVEGSSAQFSEPSVVELKVETIEEGETADFIRNVVSKVLTGNVVIYSFTPTYAEGIDRLTGTASITLPIPEGVKNPAVYYVPDGSELYEKMPTVHNGDGTLTFTTTHFSDFVVGESTEIKVADPQTGTTTIPDSETVYVRVDQLTSGKKYILVNSNYSSQYGTRYALNENAARSVVTVLAEDTDIQTDDNYIRTNDATIIWTATQTEDGWIFLSENAKNYLNCEFEEHTNNRYPYNTYYTGSLVANKNSYTWTAGNSRLYTSYQGSTFYIGYSNAWNMSTTSGSRIYFYEETEIDTSTEVNYSIVGNPAEYKDENAIVVEPDSTLVLNSLLTRQVAGSEADAPIDVSTTAKYTVVNVTDDGANGDPLGVIKSINGNVVTFSGIPGKAVVKVSYTVPLADGETNPDGEGNVIVTNYIYITAIAPYHTLEITEVDDTTAIITETKLIKGEEAMKAGYALDYVYTYTDSKGESHTVDVSKIEWTSSNSKIAVLEKDEETGKVAVVFPGGQGSVQITVRYTLEGGTELKDTITMSVSKSTSTVPSDGTDDFPFYPEEGAVRINKTADAVGNFSDTGIAKVELSMTGVPYTKGNEIDVVIMVDMSTSMLQSSNGIADRVTPAVDATKIAYEELVTNTDDTYNDNRVAIYTFNGWDEDWDTYEGQEEQIVGDNPNNNIVEVLAMSKCTSEQDFEDTIADIQSAGKTGAGTNYAAALKQCYTTLQATKDANRKQYVIFLTDGVPTTGFATLENGAKKVYDYDDLNSGGNNSDEQAAELNLGDKTEYYSNLMKAAGVSIYTVGLQLNENDADDVEGLQILRNIAGTSEGDGDDAAFAQYAQTVSTTESVDKLTSIFHSIANAIKEAATDVHVVDEVGNNYDINFSLPSGVTATETDGLSEFYIQVGTYKLDANNERTDEFTVKENFTFNVDGTFKSHTVDGATCTTCTTDDPKHVVIDTTGKITAINGKYFKYYIDEKGSEFLTWDEEKINADELVMQYFAYLHNSGGVENAAQQMKPGTYYTNEEATVTYTNFKGTECSKEFPVPSMTWKGAKVTYRFYLVNDAGEPVNESGRVIPFAEAVWIGKPVEQEVFWNELDEQNKLMAKDLTASGLVPGVYSLYDTNAYYEIRVYETEGVDTNGVNYNYFAIEGSADIANKTTTKVFNTLAGARYQDYGAYTEHRYVEGTDDQIFSIKTASGNEYLEPTVISDINFADTTVAFAVKWVNGLKEDAVVLDYGLDVLIDVTINDGHDDGVTGLRTDVPMNDDGTDYVGINTVPYEENRSGEQFTAVFVRNYKELALTNGEWDYTGREVGYATADMTVVTDWDELETLPAATTKVWLDDTDTVGMATIANKNTVRFSMGETATVFNKPAVFYYESDCSWSETDKNGTTTYNKTLYSSITVIPATSVYYEDTFLELSSFTKTDSTWNEDENSAWVTVQDKDVVDALGDVVQATDRPGVTNNMEQFPGFDANNNYGYDGAYGSSSTYSLGEAKKIHIQPGVYGTAKFSFYGTGFDVISLTDNTTGVLSVKVYEGGTKTLAKNNSGKTMSLSVDTYYGYDYGWYEVTYIYTHSGWMMPTIAQNGGKDPAVKCAAPETDPGSVEKQLEDYATNTLKRDPKIGDKTVVKQMYWKQVNNETNALYQVPVLKITDLPYGRYDVEVKASYYKDLDHTATENTDGTADGYDLYIDAIRIYDPTGVASGSVENDVVMDAYQKDGEAWPVYQEVRNLVITANDFDALTDGKQTSGVMFIDSQSGTYTIDDYKAYGPNNELYLANNQTIAFVLDLTGQNAADVQIGLKSANSDPVYVAMRRHDGNKVQKSTAEITTGSATDRYYSIGSKLDMTGSNILSFTNTGTGVLSITNIKITFKENPYGISLGDMINSTSGAGNAVLMTLRAEAEEKDPITVEPEVKLDADMDVSIRKTSVKAGSSTVVKITTSSDVAALTVNGTEIAKYTQNKVTGKRTWTTSVKAEEEGTLDIVVTAYSADGDVLETITETIEVTAKKANTVQTVVGNIVGKLFG